jgi:hypothetical protein
MLGKSTKLNARTRLEMGARLNLIKAGLGDEYISSIDNVAEGYRPPQGTAFTINGGTGKRLCYPMSCTLAER